MKNYQEIKVKNVVIGNSYYFDEGLTLPVYKKVKAVSERISPSGDRIVMFFCPFYTKKDGKSKHQELTSINTVFELKNMKRQNVIILIYPDKEPICRGNFKKLCEEFDFPYHSLKMKNFPIVLNDATIYRVPFK